ncbi:MAG: HEPN domain-containing protein [Candidatus Asgardarchaeia archaeon]
MRPIEWLNRARSFLKASERSFNEKDLEVAAFESYQAVELALKAIHIYKFGTRPYTHNLVELGKVVGFEHRNLQLLTLMYTYARYPEAPLNLDDETVGEFIDAARRAVKFAEQELERQT